MADHRVTDLSYGHVGNASYDTEENEWKFSVNLDDKSSVQQLTPFIEWLPASIRELPQSKEKPSLLLKSQRRWLSKSCPEVFPADVLASNLSKADTSQQDEFSTHTGSLLAIGRAVDVNRVSGSRATQILAVAYGNSGHILRLIRPRVDTRGWGKHSAASLNLLDSESPEYGHWAGEAGVIRQILASDNEDGGTWLAVRQDTATTIFRPQYGKLHDASSTSNGLPERFPVSQLNPNAVVTLTVDKTQSRTHADVTFNPWYARQFAVVDTLGIWSIWNVEPSHGKGSIQILVPGLRGGIYDDFEPDPSGKPLDFGHSDGWYKILWVCNISTVVVCNRRHLAVVDLRVGISRLQTGDLILPNSQEWIVDIKRSSTSDNHLFVLTTSRIFWLEIAPHREVDEQDKSVVKVLLSYRHFRNADDETIKLVVLKDHAISILITSSTNPLVQFYCFSKVAGPQAIPSSYKGAFSFMLQDSKTLDNALSHLCFSLRPLRPRSSLTSSEAGLEYLENDVNFYQVWALSKDLGLTSTLYAIQNRSTETASRALSITAPNLRIRQSVRRFGARVIEDSFIVPDGEEDGEDIDGVGRDTLQHDMQAILLDEWQDDLRFRINWRRVYRHAFGLDSEAKQPPREEIPTMEELFARVSDRIHHGLEDSELATSTFAELSGFDTLSDDLVPASQALRDFLQSLEPDPDFEASTTLVISNLAASSEDENLNGNTSKLPDLSSLYDQMAEYWMTSLPPKLSNIARVARYRVIRQVAMDVCLSSIGISVKNKLFSIDAPPRTQEDDAMSLPSLSKDSRISRESSPTFFSSQLAAISDREPDFRLLTPAKTTSSVHSQATSASEIKEDPAIARLRQYAISIRTKPDLGAPSILAQWPSKPGVDPARYSYEEAQKSVAAAESGNESEHRNRKEEARRRRRTERFLRQERSRAVEAAAQSMFMPSGSQPALLHAASSQSVPDVPMTQPVMGTFGSRIVQKGKKKSKKPRAAGFR